MRFYIVNLILIQLLWLFPILANAEPQLSIALKGGPNAATLAEDNRSNKYGISGGLTGQLQWAATARVLIAGQMEVLYTPRGAEANIAGEYLGNVRQHYIDVMVATRPGVSFGLVSVYLLLGGGMNFLVSASKESASGAKQDITGDLHRIDVALLGGAGVAVNLPRRELGPFYLNVAFFEARHDFGLLDTDAVSGGSKNRTSSLMLGLSFALTSRQVVASPVSSLAHVDPSPP